MPSIPKLYVGPPGVGKTATILASYDFCEVALLSTMTEEDIAGLPYHTKNVEHRTEPPLFRRLREAAAAGKRTALFLDEIDKARREVADTLLTLVASRRVGEWVLPGSTDIWAAANPPEWGGGDGVSQAMMSRFSVMEYRPDVATWAEWVQKEFQHPIATKVAQDVLANRVPLLECNGEGWKWRLTCPRTWELALRGAIAAKSEVERQEVVGGLLTPNAASCLLAHFSRAEAGEAKARDVGQRAWREAGGSTKKRSIKPYRLA